VVICGNSELSTVAYIAENIGNVVGLGIRYNDLNVYSNLDSQRGSLRTTLYQRLDRLLRTLTVANLDELTASSEGWAFDFDPINKIFFVDVNGSDVEDIIVIFNASGTVAHVEIDAGAGDGGSRSYKSEGNVLEITAVLGNALYFTQKFRYQDGCWRLIGEDGWTGYEPANFNSINYLTGQAIFDYEEGSSVSRTFDPQVSCLGEDFYSSEIKYYDD
jgi:hypothetical protein